MRHGRVGRWGHGRWLPWPMSAEVPRRGPGGGTGRIPVRRPPPDRCRLAGGTWAWVAACYAVARREPVPAGICSGTASTNSTPGGTSSSTASRIRTRSPWPPTVRPGRPAVAGPGPLLCRVAARRVPPAGRGVGHSGDGGVGLLALLLLRRGVPPPAPSPGGRRLRGVPGKRGIGAQFAYPCFSLVLMLLLADDRSPRPRPQTWLVIPVLVLCANLHGSVLPGAGLSCLYAGYRA